MMLASPNHYQKMTAGRLSDTAPEVSVIVLTMNRKDILASCLKSLSEQTFRAMEVVVVDNASSDGTGDMVRHLFPEVRYFYLDSNMGVGGGRNQGARIAGGEICIFIDDDACFENNKAIEQAVSYFSHNGRLGCLAFRIIRPEDGLEEYKSIPRADKKVIDEDYECSYFCGAGFACRRQVFLEVGMFWESLFFIGEELDLSYRLLDQGYMILRSFAISVIHHETPQARVKGQWIYFGVRSRFWVAARNLPRRYIISHTLLWWGYFLISALKNRHAVYFIRGIRDGIRGLSEALRERRRISNKTIKRLKQLSGRVYY